MFLLKVTLVSLLLCKSAFGIGSPCPGIFEYYYENSGKLNGLISVAIPKNFGNTIRLDVEFTVGNLLQGFIGKIHLRKSFEDTLQDILHNGPILYKLEFPGWINLQPKITKILVNGNKICTGNSIEQKAATTISTVNLKYILTVNFTKRQNSLLTFLNTFESISSPSTQEPTTERVEFTPVDIDPRFSVDNQFVYDAPVVENAPVVIYAAHSFTPSPQPSSSSFTTTASSIVRFQNTYGDTLDSLEKICGLVDNTVTLIAKGDAVRKADYPWLGALFKTTATEARFMCGATLITKKHAITAGHCVHGVSPHRLYIILGRENIYHWLSDGVQIQIKDTFIHEGYIPRKADADIAILMLSVEIVLTSTVRPICLWNGNDDLEYVVGRNGVVVGWGRDENGNYTTTPRKSVLPIVSYEDCLRSNVGFGFITSNRTFCAGLRNEAGPCNGDSGSGFYLKENGKWALRGIVSLALIADEICDLKNYVVFVDIAQFKNWILAYISS